MTRFILLLLLFVGSHVLADPLIVDTTDSVVNVVSGTYEGGVVTGNGTLNFGGTAEIVDTYLQADLGGGTLNVFGGYTEALECQAGDLNISGGYVGNITMLGCDNVNVFGGDVVGFSYGSANVGIFIFGYDFEYTLYLEDSTEEIEFRGGMIRPRQNTVVLGGFLADGTALEMLFFPDDRDPLAWESTTLVDVGNPNDVPEPGSLALLTLGLGGLGFARRRMRS